MTRPCVRWAAWSGAGLAAASLGGAGPVAAQFVDQRIAVFALADQLEYNRSVAGRPFQWDVSVWVGNSYTRLWIKSEGDWNTVGRGRQFDLRAEYSRLITPFWDFQAGVRLEARRSGTRTDTRGHLTFGLLGLAPYRFQLEPELFLAQDGQVSIRLTAEYDLLLTQRLIMQPRFETYAAFSENRTFGVGSGLNYIEPGLRLRYEIRRELAPYVGLVWLRRLGGTARLARGNGQDAGDLALVVGLRVWH
jgi:copper resistance protein B